MFKLPFLTRLSKNPTQQRADQSHKPMTAEELDVSQADFDRFARDLNISISNIHHVTDEQREELRRTIREYAEIINPDATKEKIDQFVNITLDNMEGLRYRFIRK